MSTIAFILLVALNGLIVGALARLALPGKDPMSILQTILIGMAGSLVGGIIAYYAFGEEEGPGFLLALVCTVALVYAVRKLRERDDETTTGPTAP
ncbi:MAG: GlsB/YeaQ/YmgE family stress response membrane protein [Actinomycetota bacterium]|nr:GlsB/YeaQ/YmgE family stress response membrane protein [Actinomycetota bacterium]